MTLLFLVILFLLLSALFSGSEIAYVSADKLVIELEKEKKTKRANIIARFYKNPERFISTMLVGNNIALVLFTGYMTDLLTPYLTRSIHSQGLIFIAITLITTAVVLIFGEYLPKTLFRLYANQIIIGLARPLSWISSLLRAPASIMMALSRGLLRLITGKTIETEVQSLTRLDLQNFIQGQASGEDEEQVTIDTEIFNNALNLKQTKVRECMVPRTEIVHLDQYAPVHELIALFQETRHSRIVITRDGIEDIVGYVHHQSLLDPNVKTIRKGMIDMPYVPETMSVMDVLRMLRKVGRNMACVVDEFGGTAGIVTLEDVIEEIFGEIEDEHDKEEHLSEKLADDRFRFSGRMEIDAIHEKYPEIQIPDGEYTTLSGYIVMTSGNIPETGDDIIIGNHRFVLEQVSDTKIEVVELNIMVEEEG